MYWLTPRDDLSKDRVYQLYKKRMDQIFDKMLIGLTQQASEFVIASP